MAEKLENIKKLKHRHKWEQIGMVLICKICRKVSRPSKLAKVERQTRGCFGNKKNY